MTAFPHLKPAKGLLPAVGQSRDHGPSKRKYSDYHEYFPKRTNESFPLIQRRQRTARPPSGLSVKGEAKPPPERFPKATKQEGVANRRPGTVQSLKTCPQCAHLADKVKSGIPLHSLLAYTRCRCHRPAGPEDTGGGGPVRNRPVQDVALVVGRERPSTRDVGKEHERSSMLFRRRSLASRRSSKEAIAPKATLPRLDNPCLLESASRDILVSSIVISQETSLGAPSGLSSSGRLHRSSTLTASTDMSKHSSSRLSHLPSISMELKSHTSITSNSNVLGVSPSFQKLSVIPEPSSGSFCLRQNTEANIPPSHLRKDSSRVFTRKKTRPFCLLTLVKFVGAHKQKLLKELFISLDNNDDGHLSYDEVCKGVATLNLPASSLHFLHKLYNVLSELTYFGKREFVLAYSVAELLSQGRPPLSSYFIKFSKIDRDHISDVLLPLVEESSKHASGDGKLSFAQFQHIFHKNRRRMIEAPYPFETISLVEVLAFGLLF